MNVTPVLLMDKIEPSLQFWVDRMGWQKMGEVPDGETLAFAMLSQGGAMLMLQTLGSVLKDEPKFASSGSYRASIFIQVDDWADVKRRLDGYEITMPERETFYGMREIGVFEPGGNVVVFAVPLAGH